MASLQTEGFNFQAIVDINIQDDTGALGLAIDAQNTYLESGNSFIVSPGGTITGGFGTTVQDYFGLVTATGGIAGDIDQIAASPQTANVFSQVLVSSIVGHPLSVTLFTRLGSRTYDEAMTDVTKILSAMEQTANAFSVYPHELP